MDSPFHLSDLSDCNKDYADGEEHVTGNTIENILGRDPLAKVEEIESGLDTFVEDESEAINEVKLNGLY